MRNFLLTIFSLLTFSYVYGEQWQDHWMSAVEYCGGKNYEAAEVEFNQAITCLECKGDETHPHVYVDRARLYVLQNRYTEALTDLNKAISSEHLTANDRIRGLVTRIVTCSNLQMNEQTLADFNTFKTMNPNFPKVEFSNDRVIIRNAPKSSCYKKLAKAFLVGSGICEKESDIVELNTGIMIARRNSCNCGCDQILKFDPQKTGTNQQDVDKCKYWCDKCALAGMAWCAKVFKRWDCQTGYIFAVDLIKDGCYWCCGNGNFYQRCIKPFEDIVKYMPQPCEPEWD